MGFDEQVVRLDKEIAELANEFVLVRIINMRGVNLDIFDFDYDLAWAGFFLNADGKIYGRFGGRNGDSPEQYLTQAGLKYAMQQALAAHRLGEQKTSPKMEALPRTVDQYPGAKRLNAKSCIHCHQAYDLEREQLRLTGQWRREDVWVYPLPENIGLTMGDDQGNRVRTVAADSPAALVGLRGGDVLKTIQGMCVASFADVQYALHRAPAKGRLNITWEREEREHAGELALREGWRQTDISWRASTLRLGPAPSVRGQDLTAAEKKALGLPEGQLAFRQGNFVSRTAQQAGIRQDDVILGIDDKVLAMSARQFAVYIRLNFRVGDQVTFNILRSGQLLQIPLRLPSPEPY